MSNETQRSVNPGTLVFGAFAVLSLFAALAHGFPPIDLAEVALWTALAWYWQKRNPTSAVAISLVMLLAVVVAAGEGYVFGLKQGRFIPYNDPRFPHLIGYAVDTKTGMRCRTWRRSAELAELEKKHGVEDTLPPACEDVDRRPPCKDDDWSSCLQPVPLAP